MTIPNLVINDFRLKQFTKAQMNELMFYAKHRNDPKIFCHRIAWAITSNGNTHGHQKRISRKTKRKLERHLLKIYPQLSSLKDFDELRELIRIKGIGDLTVYDTAERIGYAFGLQPEKVYIHQGAKVGAKHLLGSKAVRGRNFLYMHEFPEEFQILTPREVENLLCIYKDTFLTGKLPGTKTSCNGQRPKVQKVC